MDLKKIGNIVFYTLFIILTVYFVKRKFIVPKVAKEQLVFQNYNTKQSIGLNDFPDKLIVVNFWQTWCGPCVHEMPSLNEMSEVWDGIQVLCVSDEPLAKVESFMQAYPNIYFVCYENIAGLGVTQFPTTYIYNPEGTRVYSKIGSKDWSDPNFIATLKKNWSK